jgi:hypothetical protein
MYLCVSKGAAALTVLLTCEQASLLCSALEQVMGDLKITGDALSKRVTA